MKQKDLRQLLIHRHKLVRIRVQVKNELQHLAMNQGVTKKAEVVEQGGREGAARVAAAAVGQPAARRPVEGKRNAERADCLLDQAVVEAARAKRKSAAADDAAGRGTDHLAGLRADDGRCFPFSAGQAGGQLSGADSAGVQFGREAAAGIDQQTRQSVYEDVAGGSGADGGALRSADAEGVFASLPQQGERRGQSGGGEEVGDSTLLDAAHAKAVSRGRSCREQLAGAAGQRKLDRRIDWALSSRCRSGFG